MYFQAAKRKLYFLRLSLQRWDLAGKIGLDLSFRNPDQLLKIVLCALSHGRFTGALEFRSQCCILLFYGQRQGQRGQRQGQRGPTPGPTGPTPGPTPVPKKSVPDTNYFSTNTARTPQAALVWGTMFWDHGYAMTWEHGFMDARRR